MGDFSRAIMIACLQVLRWLLFVTGALMLVLIIVQQVRGDTDAAPLALGISAAAMLVGGYVCGRAGAYFERMR